MGMIAVVTQGNLNVSGHCRSDGSPSWLTVIREINQTTSPESFGEPIGTADLDGIFHEFYDSFVVAMDTEADETIVLATDVQGAVELTNAANTLGLETFGEKTLPPPLDIDVTDVAYHRNGVGGNGFHVVLFTDPEIPGHTFVATVFEEPHSIAVLATNLLAVGDVAFGSNSWRGDNYERDCREAIRRWNDAGRPSEGYKAVR
jgi:hypothetical protein